jgi:hypothetical protein
MDFPDRLIPPLPAPWGFVLAQWTPDSPFEVTLARKHIERMFSVNAEATTIREAFLKALDKIGPDGLPL